MTARYLSSKSLPDPKGLGHSQIAAAGPYERVAALAGQSGHDHAGVLSEHFEDQLRQALDNVAAVLSYAGGSLEDVVRLHLLVADYRPERLEEIGLVLRTRWQPLMPAVTVVPVPRLALDGMLVEVEATATLDSERRVRLP